MSICDVQLIISPVSLVFKTVLKIVDPLYVRITFIGTIIAGTINIMVAWWLLTSIENICQDQLLGTHSPWTCPSDRDFYDVSVIWGLVGQTRIFGSLEPYSAVNWFFLGSFLGPLMIYLFHKAFPSQNYR
ncbi:hypothetical protein L2E82_23021 [Cichorium intybus]|uniref:Uncharacterized protein n=1 Tax=Cichorium intybus TaxID=13427 RepID=A0ACB9DZD1_CICIN|nr:hypothetical protein L2E82_23021 [Cichorium intybus]